MSGRPVRRAHLISVGLSHKVAWHTPTPASVNSCQRSLAMLLPCVHAPTCRNSWKECAKVCHASSYSKHKFKKFGWLKKFFPFWPVACPFWVGGVLSLCPGSIGGKGLCLRFMDRTEEAHIYTDGATTLGAQPKAGWGLVRIDRPAGQEEAEGKLMTKQYGRLTGHQNNYKAEARALLAALCSAPAVMPMHIYIDNLGVVQRWDKNKKEDTRGRAKDKARAIWNRIEHMRGYREAWGTKTRIAWVHSHVDEDKEKEGNEKEEKKAARGSHPPLQCACGAPKGECDVNHPHHRGNDMADAEAKQGMNSQDNTDTSAMEGEDDWVMKVRGQLCEGDVKDDLTQAAVDRRRRAIGQSSSKRARMWHSAVSKADPYLRSVTMKLSTVSRRFIVRASTDTLPLYKHEVEKIGHKESTYTRMYGDMLGEGQCRRCGNGDIEDMHHVMVKCKCGKEGRMEMLKDIRAAWKELGVEEHMDYIMYLDEPPMDWVQWWGWIGLVPATVMQDIKQHGKNRALQAAMKKTVKLIAKAAENAWKVRNDEVQEWEKEQGIKDRKTEVRRAKGAMRGAVVIKRPVGRPKKQFHELCAASKRKILRDNAMATLTPVYGEEGAKKKHRQDQKEQKDREKRDAAAAAVPENNKITKKGKTHQCKCHFRKHGMLCHDADCALRKEIHDRYAIADKQKKERVRKTEAAMQEKVQASIKQAAERQKTREAAIKEAAAGRRKKAKTKTLGKRVLRAARAADEAEEANRGACLKMMRRAKREKKRDYTHRSYELAFDTVVRIKKGKYKNKRGKVVAFENCIFSDYPCDMQIQTPTEWIEIPIQDDCWEVVDKGPRPGESEGDCYHLDTDSESEEEAEEDEVAGPINRTPQSAGCGGDEEQGEPGEPTQDAIDGIMDTDHEAEPEQEESENMRGEQDQGERAVRSSALHGVRMQAPAGPHATRSLQHQKKRGTREASGEGSGTPLEETCTSENKNKKRPLRPANQIQYEHGHDQVEEGREVVRRKHESEDIRVHRQQTSGRAQIPRAVPPQRDPACRQNRVEYDEVRRPPGQDGGRGVSEGEDESEECGNTTPAGGSNQQGDRRTGGREGQHDQERWGQKSNQGNMPDPKNDPKNRQTNDHTNAMTQEGENYNSKEGTARDERLYEWTGRDQACHTEHDAGDEDEPQTHKDKHRHRRCGCCEGSSCDPGSKGGGDDRGYREGEGGTERGSKEVGAEGTAVGSRSAVAIAGTAHHSSGGAVSIHSGAPSQGHTHRTGIRVVGCTRGDRTLQGMGQGGGHGQGAEEDRRKGAHLPCGTRGFQTGDKASRGISAVGDGSRVCDRERGTGSMGVTCVHRGKSSPGLQQRETLGEGQVWGGVRNQRRAGSDRCGIQQCVGMVAEGQDKAVLCGECGLQCDTRQGAGDEQVRNRVQSTCMRIWETDRQDIPLLDGTAHPARIPKVRAEQKDKVQSMQGRHEAQVHCSTIQEAGGHATEAKGAGLHTAGRCESSAATAGGTYCHCYAASTRNRNPVPSCAGISDETDDDTEGWLEHHDKRHKSHEAHGRGRPLFSQQICNNKRADCHRRSRIGAAARIGMVRDRAVNIRSRGDTTVSKRKRAETRGGRERESVDSGTERQPERRATRATTLRAATRVRMLEAQTAQVSVEVLESTDWPPAASSGGGSRAAGGSRGTSQGLKRPAAWQKEGIG